MPNLLMQHMCLILREIERALEENECSNQGNEDIISDLVAKNFSLEEQNTYYFRPN